MRKRLEGEREVLEVGEGGRGWRERGRGWREGLEGGARKGGVL